MASLLALGAAQGISAAVMGDYLPELEMATRAGRRKVEEQS